MGFDLFGSLGFGSDNGSFSGIIIVSGIGSGGFFGSFCLGGIIIIVVIVVFGGFFPGGIIVVVAASFRIVIDGFRRYIVILLGIHSFRHFARRRNLQNF